MRTVPPHFHLASQMYRISRHIIATTAAFLLICLGQAEATGHNSLPFQLQYFMKSNETALHMRALAQYKVDSGDDQIMAFVVPDPATGTRTALFLRFSDDQLVGVTSGRYGMSEQLYERYMSQLASMANSWKSLGVETIIESGANNIYVYKDHISYITISGAKYSDGYQAEISFAEIEFDNLNR